MHLNLMPIQQKQNLEKERMFLIAHNFLGLIFLIASFIAIVLIIVRFALLQNFNQIREETSLVNTVSQSFLKDIDILNQKIDFAQIAQKDFSKWSLALSRLQAVFPDQVRLNYLFINRESNSIRFSGESLTRDALLNTKSALETSNILESLEAPLSNLLQKNNVEFRFNGILKKDIWNLK